MAIVLDVKDYCSKCYDFEPDVTKPERIVGYDICNNPVLESQTDTIVRCRYARRCENIKRYLERSSNHSGE